VAQTGSGPPLVLVVDPDESDARVISKMLGRAGYSTLHARRGDEAVAIAKREKPHVVLLEICLPEISGYQVCHELRETFGTAVSIVFLSGTRTEPYDRVAGLLLGADDYLVKPVAGDEVLARVRNLLGRSAMEDSSVASSLTPREEKILELVAQGLDQKQIAGRLLISPRTVGTHMAHIFAKLGVRNRAQAVAFVSRRDRPKRWWANLSTI
jgi:two-component system sensor histidine kinase ChiS